MEMGVAQDRGVDVVLTHPVRAVRPLNFIPSRIVSRQILSFSRYRTRGHSKYTSHKRLLNARVSSKRESNIRRQV
jgi:hypothetical protein